MRTRTVFTCLCTLVCIGGLAAHAMAARPIVYYSFDTLSNVVLDESGNGNDGTINGGVTLDAGGHLGKCFAFNGQNTYIQLNRVIQDNFAITAWVKTSTAGRAGAQAYEGSGLFWSDVAGAGNDFVVAALGTKLSFFAGNPDTSVNSKGDIVTGEWVHIAAVRDIAARTLSIYIAGKLDNSVSHSNTGPLNANSNFMIGANTLDSRYYTGLMDEVRIYDSALPEAEIRAIMKGVPLAEDPDPENGALDVPRDAILGWTAGETAAAHDVYLGTTFADVNDAGRDDLKGILVSQGQTATEYAPAAVLEYGQTYFWRIDEVNGAPDNTIFKGDLWSFTVEPFGYPITGVTATASGYQGTMAPQNTVNGSGLNDQDQHSTEPMQMWMSNGVKPAWIQFQFDKPYKLHEMLVWNSNQLIESMLGFGAKTVKVEYSTDGQTWMQLEGVPEFAQATGTATYTANTTVGFGGAMAQYVKLTIETNWGGIAPQTGLSEVRFFHVPVQAFDPQPAVGATVVSVETELNWRPGREATSHTVYIGADRDAVAGGLVAGHTMADHGYTPALDLGTTYYWKVDEAGDVGTYSGSIWSFTTEEYVSLDDFEDYTDDEGFRIYEAWIDGLTVGDSGSTVGYMQAPFAEKTVVHGGSQSMPLAYDNTFSPFYSEAARTFDSPQDWTRYGITTLVVHFRGQVTNTPAPVYVKINGTKVSLDNNAATAMPLWKSWAIPLAATGANLKSVKSLAIGVDGSGMGTLFVDDIRLYAAAPEIAGPIDPGTAGLVALYAMDGNVQDTSGKNYHGTLKGTAAYDTGYSGQALVLNGTDAHVDLPIGPLMPSLTDTTIATHVYFAGGSGAWQRIFDFGSGSGASPYMFLCPRQGTNGNMRFAIRTATVAEQLVNSPAPMSIGWHHVAVTIDSQARTINLYLDGGRIASAATTLFPKDLGNTTQNWIGRSQYATDAYLNGSIDDFRIYNRVLSDAELRHLAGDR